MFSSTYSALITSPKLWRLKPYYALLGTSLLSAMLFRSGSHLHKYIRYAQSRTVASCLLYIGYPGTHEPYYLPYYFTRAKGWAGESLVTREPAVGSRLSEWSKVQVQVLGLQVLTRQWNTSRRNEDKPMCAFQTAGWAKIHHLRRAAEALERSVQARVPTFSGYSG